MPEIELTNVWSSAFELFAGQVLEVRGAGEIWISQNLTDPSYDTSAVVTLQVPLTVTQDMLVRARSGTIAGNTLAIIEVDDGVNTDPVVFGPLVQTRPVLMLGTDGVLRRNAGTATGLPVPVRVTAWAKDGVIIAGETGDSYNPRGVPGVYTTHDIWTGAINQPVYADSDPVEVTMNGGMVISPAAGNILQLTPEGLYATAPTEDRVQEMILAAIQALLDELTPEMISMIDENTIINITTLIGRAD